VNNSVVEIEVKLMTFAKTPEPKPSTSEDDLDVEVPTPEERLEALTQRIKRDMGKTQIPLKHHTKKNSNEH
jgi:hypothetical protein